MNTTLPSLPARNAPTTFLSYTSADRPIVEATANHLCRYGIIPWFDQRDIELGHSLKEYLQQVIEDQDSITVFMSENSMRKSTRWVGHELQTAWKRWVDEGIGRDNRIIPVYLGDPKDLIQNNQLQPEEFGEELKKQWLLGDDPDKVDRLGIVPPDPERCLEEPEPCARQIAEAIAFNKIYRGLELRQARDIVIVIDQRGEGPRSGQPDLPALPPEVDPAAPALVFRPDLGERTRDQVLSGPAWADFQQTLRQALGRAIGSPRSHPQNIVIQGDAQLALPFVLGDYFERNSMATLYGTHASGQTFTNSGQPREAPLNGGNPNVFKPHDRAPTEHRPHEALVLMSQSRLGAVVNYLKHHPELPQRPLWVEPPERLEDSKQVMDLVRDLCTSLQARGPIQRLYLFTQLPFHAQPLLAANLKHVVKETVFMEYQKTKPEPESYVGLPIGQASPGA